MSATGGVIDSFFISLGFKPETGGLKAFERQADGAKERILSIGTALTAFATGFAVKEIAAIGDQFEQNQIALAGFLSALGVSSDFNAGLKDADATLQSITKAAALLPGEAEDYIGVFRAGLMGIKGAMPDGTLDEMTKFSNTFTAVGRSLQVDAPQIGRDLSMMLGVKGRAGAQVLTFQRMLPFMMQVAGQAGLTAEAFNAMSQPKRLQLLQAAFVKLQPMIDASADSFDAMKGAAISAIKQLVRLGTKGLFAGMKKGLAEINAIFFKADGTITDFGQEVVDTGAKIGRVVTNVVTFGAAIVKWFGKSEVTAKVLKGALVLLGAALAALAFEKTAAGVAKLFTGLLDLKRLLLGGLFLAIALVAEDLYVFYKGGDSVTGMLVNKLGPAGLWLSKTVLGGLVVTLAAVRFAFVRTAIKAAASWALMLGPLTLVAVAIAALAYGIYYAYKHWDEFGPKAKTALSVILTLAPIAIGLFVAMKAAAIAAAIQIAIGFAVMAAPIWIVIAALVATGVTLYLLWKHWEQITGFMREHWVAFGAFLTSFPVFGPILLLITTLGQHWGDMVDEMKDAWNSFAETVNGLGVVELPTFKRPQMLPAGEGVELPKNGPAQGGWQLPYTGGPAIGGWNPIAPGLEGPPAPTALLGPSNQGKRANAAFVSGAQGGYAGGAGLSPYAGAIPSAQMSGARAGAGALSSVGPAITNITNVNTTVPAINITGASNPRETAREVQKAMERANRNVIRDANSKGPKI